MIARRLGSRVLEMMRISHWMLSVRSIGAFGGYARMPAIHHTKRANTPSERSDYDNICTQAYVFETENRTKENVVLLLLLMNVLTLIVSS